MTKEKGKDKKSSLETFLKENIPAKEIYSGIGPQNLTSSDELDECHPYVDKLMLHLVDQKILSRYTKDEELEPLTQEKILEWSRSPNKVMYNDDDNSLIVEKDSGEKLVVTDNLDYLQPDFIAAAIEEPNFNVTQDGDIRKAKEAAAAFQMVILNRVTDGMFNAGISRVMNGYNYTTLEGALRPDKTKYTFTDLLDTTQANISAVLRIVIQAAKIKISSAKTKKEQMLYKELSPSEADALIDLTLTISQLRIDAQSKERLLDAKSEIEKVREDLAAEIKRRIQTSKIPAIYFIFKICNVQYLRDSIRNGIAEKSIEAVSEIVLKEGIDIEASNLRANIMRKLRRRAVKEQVLNLKQDLMADFRAGGYVEPLKRI